MKILKDYIKKTNETLDVLKKDSTISDIAYNVIKQRNNEALSLCDASSSRDKKRIEDYKDRIEIYKECFEIFINVEKWDEANLFLSTYGSGLAKDLARKQR